MKKNLPITDNEVFFTEELISTTDLKGAITDYNAAFKRVSGFDDNELRGHNHNVVRHPDMPPAAFQDLWDTLKQKQHWMGLVKNRTKTGDFYWVDAYVTPILENGEVTGYESVRVKPDPEVVARARKVYAQINAGRKPALTGLMGRLPIKTRADIQHLSTVAVTLLALAMLAGVHPVLQFTVAALAGMGTGWLLKKWVFASLDKAVKAAAEEMNNPLMALIYTGYDDEIGQIALINKLTQAKLRDRAGQAATHRREN